jgi:methionyl-tRNA formyltransferase
MKIIFAGTPVFATVALKALLQSAHELIAVYTQPDRPAGRGLKLTMSPVKQLALQAQIPVYQPISLKDKKEQDFLASLKADVMVVAAYGLILPEAILNIPPFGCINIHPSLLPRWRGAAPIQRTIFFGDKITGVTIMQMNAGLDTGDMLLQHQYVLAEDDTSQTLHDKLAKIGADSLIETLDLLTQHNTQPIKQNNELATYADKISKSEALIDWQDDALNLEYKVRAFNPWPVAYTMWQGDNLRIWMAKAVSQTVQAAPGTIIRAGEDGIDIAAKNGILRLLQLQLPGGKILSSADFYHAKHHQLIPGQAFA